MPRRSLHYAAKLLLSPITVPVRKGPQQGTRFSLTSGSHFWLGNYEPENAAMMERSLRPGDIAFDVGAHVGYFTIYMSRLVGPGGHVHCFEPRGINLRFLRRHLRVNRIENVTVHEACVGDSSRSARLETRQGGTGTAFLSESGDLPVRMVSLDDMIDRGELPVPKYIKVDVEGAETRVLRGAERLLSRHHPRLLVATHSPELFSECSEVLREYGYDVDSLFNKELIAVPPRAA